MLGATRLRGVQAAGLLSGRLAQSVSIYPFVRGMASTTYKIPKTMKAAIIRDTGSPLEIVEDQPVPQPADLKPGECLVKLDCTGVCHTDLHCAKGDWPIQAKHPLIGGHEARSLMHT